MKISTCNLVTHDVSGIHSALSAHCKFAGRGYIDGARNMEVILRSLGRRSNEKTQEDGCLI